MATLTIRGLDEDTKARLRVRAAQNGHSMEEEARQLLRRALAAKRTASGKGLAQTIQERFAGLRGDELEIPPRQPMRRPPDLE